MRILSHCLSQGYLWVFPPREHRVPRPLPLQLGSRELVGRVYQLRSDFREAKKVIETALLSTEDAAVRQATRHLLSYFTKEKLQQFFEALDGDPELWERALNVAETSPLTTFLREAFPEEAYIREAYRAFPVARAARTPSNPSLEALTSFFPNLGRIFFRTFTLLNPRRSSASLYEYHCLLQAYFLFFHIPYNLVKVLHHCLQNTLTVAIASFLCFSIAIGLLWVYLKWGRHFPEQISSCRRLEPLAEYATAQHRKEEIDHLKSNLQGVGSSVLLVGEPGVGKTHLIHHLPHLFPERRVFLFKNWELFYSTLNSLNAGQKMDMAFGEAAGYHDKIIFCLDELGDTLQSQDAASILTLLKSLENHSRVHLVLGLTKKQYTRLSEADPSIMQRFSIRSLEPIPSDRVDGILWQKLRSLAIPYKREDLPRFKDFAATAFPGQANPRAALRFIEEAGRWVQSFQPETYQNEELIAKKQALALAQAACVRGEGTATLASLQSEINTLEEQHKPWRTTAAKVQKLQHLYLKIDANLSKSFSRFHYQIALPALSQAIETLASTLPPEMPVRLTDAIGQQWLKHRRTV